MQISTRDGNRARRDPKNLDGRLTGRGVVDSELTGIIPPESPDRPVRQKNGGVTRSTRHGRRARDV